MGTRIPTAVVAAILAACAGALARQQPGRESGDQAGSKPGERNPASTDAALSGPRVVEAARRASIVARDYSGKLRPLETTPEEAAAALLDLDDATRRRVNGVIADYAARVDALVADNLALLLRIQTAKGGPRAEYAAVLRELGEKTKPLRERGGLRAEIGRELPPAARQAFESMLKEYWDAAVSEAQSDIRETADAEEKPGAGDAEGLRRRAMVRVALAGAGAELRRSFERQVGAREEAFREFSRELDLSPDQDAAIKKIFTDLYVETLGKPTPDQRRDAVMKAFALLNRDQKLALSVRLLAPPAPK